MGHRLYDILHRWTHATDDEVTFVKTMLMPEDDADHLTFSVVEHPNIRPNGGIYIEWFDIEMYDRRRCEMIGSIAVWTTDGRIEYTFV